MEHAIFIICYSLLLFVTAHVLIGLFTLLYHEIRKSPAESPGLFVECAIDGRRKLMRVNNIAAADYDKEKGILTLWFTTSPSSPFVMRGAEAAALGNYLATRTHVLSIS